MSGSIYAIRNLVTGDIYIGATRKRVEHRFKEHERGMRLGKHSNRALQVAWHEHGPESFAFEVLEPVAHPWDLCERETHWLDWALARGFNLYNVNRRSWYSIVAGRTKPLPVFARELERLARDAPALDSPDVPTA